MTQIRPRATPSSPSLTAPSVLNFGAVGLAGPPGWGDLQFAQQYHGVAAMAHAGWLNDLLAVEFVDRHSDTNIRYVISHPGGVVTGFAGECDHAPATAAEVARLPPVARHPSPGLTDHGGDPACEDARAGSPPPSKGMDMETWDAITSRRNVREFADRPIEASVLDQILEAGRRAPSSRNQQLWDFVVVTDREQLQQLSTVWQGAGHVAGSAATIALVFPEIEEQRPRETARYDLGQATMAIMIAAADRGVGTGHSSIGDQAKAREILGVPEDRLIAYLIDLGYPADRPLKPIKRPNRRPFAEVVHYGRW